MAQYPVVGSPRIASGFLPPGRPNHFGLDLAGAVGDVVQAPEAGTVVRAVSSPDPERAANTTLEAPWGGYGPGVVVVQGASGMFHLLAHLSGVDVAVGDVVDEGQVVGEMASHVGAAGPHVHWEVRSVAVDRGPATRAAFTVDPQVWLAGQGVKVAMPRSTAAAGGAGGVWLVLALLYLLSRR